MQVKHIAARFVEFIPKTIEDGVLYISEQYQTASHNCACGCGMRVVTPLTPIDWKLTKHGSAVSLHPSIGNWDYPCRSHYFIDRGRIIWAKEWSSEEILHGRQIDVRKKEEFYRERGAEATWLRRLSAWIKRRF